ncbi:MULTISPECIES: hypothetical protein [Enterobacter]|uniref:hypothetical protein n=1 Tax=Enterobacter TaxID=547 RepID=UPI001D02243D|nr:MULTISPECIES: hypothetical protein [Enterobacter]
MTKKYLAVVLFTALLTGVVETTTALELSQYNKLDTVSHIVNDSEVTDNLRKTLGNHYQTLLITLMSSVNRIPPQVVGCLLKAG